MDLCSSKNDSNNHLISTLTHQRFSVCGLLQLTTIHAATHMNQKSIRVRERTRGKEQSYLNGIFAEATITGRNNQDCDSAAKSDNDDDADQSISIFY